MLKYILMNKDIEVLSLEVNDSFKVSDVIEIYDIAFAPIIVLYNKNNKDGLISSLNEWFNNRAIPSYRDDISSLLAKLGVSDRYELAFINFGSSLSDQYWFKPIDLDITWDDINYFNNDYNSEEFFNATYGDDSFTPLKKYNNQLDKYDTPNNSLGGELKKTWIKKDGINYLYKSSSSLHNLEPINEVIASKICEIIDVPYVKYELDYIHSKRSETLVSICECMINEDEEFIPAYQIISNKELTYTKEDYYIYLKELNKHNIKRSEEYLDKMLMLDYIMLNEDRHLNNFGVIRNFNSLKWTRICPIFDTGRSMNTSISKAYWDFDIGEVKCFTKNYISSEELLEFINYKLSNKQLESLEDIPDEYYRILKENKEYLKLYDNDIEILYEGFRIRIDKFIKFMQNLLA